MLRPRPRPKMNLYQGTEWWWQHTAEFVCDHKPHSWISHFLLHSNCLPSIVCLFTQPSVSRICGKSNVSVTYQIQQCLRGLVEANMFEPKIEAKASRLRPKCFLVMFECYVLWCRYERTGSKAGSLQALYSAVTRSQSCHVETARLAPHQVRNLSYIKRLPADSVISDCGLAIINSCLLIINN